MIVIKKKKKITSLLSNIYIIFSLILTILPLIFCLINSFKSSNELVRSFISLPKTITFENYLYVIEKKNIFKYLLNSLIITFFGAVICFLINPFIAYMISINWNNKLYRFLYSFLSCCMFIPGNLLLYPLIKLYYRIGLMNHFGLFIYYSVFMIPESVFMLVPYFQTIGAEIVDAAQMDGSSVMFFYRKIFIPVCKPYILAILILNVVWIWNDFLMPLMILNKNPNSWTLPIFIYNFLGKNSSHKNYAYSSCQIALLPIIVFYTIFYKKILMGLNIKTMSKDAIGGEKYVNT